MRLKKSFLHLVDTSIYANLKTLEAPARQPKEKRTGAKYFHVVERKGEFKMIPSNAARRPGTIARYTDRAVAQTHVDRENLANRGPRKGETYRDRTLGPVAIIRIEGVDGNTVKVSTSYDEGKTWTKPLASRSIARLTSGLRTGSTEKVSLKSGRK